MELLDSKFSELNKRIEALETPKIDNDDDEKVELTDSEKLAASILQRQLEGFLPEEKIKTLTISELANAIELKDSILETVKKSQGSEMNPPRDNVELKDAKPISYIDAAFKPRIRGANT